MLIEGNSMKNCSKCGEDKPFSEYYKDAHNRDGINHRCKSCVYLKQMEYRKTEKGREVDRKSKEKYHQTDKGKAAKQKTVIKWRNSNPIKAVCNAMVRSAVRGGKLDKPATCEECDAGGVIHGHHDDYAYPLVVRWLCHQCHSDWHKINGAGLNGD